MIMRASRRDTPKDMAKMHTMKMASLHHMPPINDASEVRVSDSLKTKPVSVAAAAYSVKLSSVSLRRITVTVPDCLASITSCRSLWLPSVLASA